MKTIEEKKLEYNQNLLREFRTYEKNWNLYDAEPISKEVIDRVEKLLPTLSSQPMLTATADGNVGLEYLNERRNYLMFRPSLENELYEAVYIPKDDSFLSVKKMVDKSEIQEIIKAYESGDSCPIKEGEHKLLLTRRNLLRGSEDSKREFF